MQAEDRQQAERDKVNGQNEGLGHRHRLALILLAASFAVMPAVTRAWGPSGFVLIYAIAGAMWWSIRRRVLSFGTVIVIAILLRATVAFSPPLLSGDVYRYLWDGTLLSSGLNPYELAPDDARLRALRTPWHSEINHPEIRTIYPPHAQLLFAAIHHLGGWRTLIIACDLLTLCLLRRRAAQLLAVAAFPPLIVEGIWSAHVDAVSAALFTRAVLSGSAVALAFASGLKLIPLASLPALANRGGRFLALFAAIFLIPFAIFAGSGDVMPGMRDYAARWIFNSPLYSLTAITVETLHLDLALKSGWTAIKDVLALDPRLVETVYRLLHVDFITRCLLGLLAVLLIALASRRRDGAVHAIGALLVCSPVIHPWYWLTIAPLAVAQRIGPWRFFALFAPLSYLLYDGAPPLAVFALCYGLPLAISARTRLSEIATSIAEWHRAAIRSHTAPDTSRS